MKNRGADGRVLSPDSPRMTVTSQCTTVFGLSGKGTPRQASASGERRERGPSLASPPSPSAGPALKSAPVLSPPAAWRSLEATHGHPDVRATVLSFLPQAAFRDCGWLPVLPGRCSKVPFGWFAGVAAGGLGLSHAGMFISLHSSVHLSGENENHSSCHDKRSHQTFC